MDDDDDEAARRRQQYRELFGTVEQQKVEANELAARQAQAEKDEVLAWCRERAAAKQQRPDADTKTHALRVKDVAETAKYWKGYIRDEIRKNTQFVFDTIATETARVVGNELNEQDRYRKLAVADMKSHYNDICNRFDDHPTHDVVKALRTRIDELQSRIDQLEAAAKPAQLRAVS